MYAGPETCTRPATLLLPVLVAAFLIGLLPFTADYLLFHPDERHYVDAGLQMVQTGDYLTPRTAEGELRLKKPILPYWVVVAGFQLAGVSPLGARIGFLGCGAGVVALAWWGAMIAFDCRRAGCFAAVAAITQPALLISAPRSVPDVCLALGVQLSVCGCLLILRAGRATYGGLAAAFGGGAVAVLSKGLPGAVFLGYALLFLAWRAPALLRHDWRRWASAAALGLCTSGSWFVLMAWLHRDALARQFTEDQLGRNRFSTDAWQPLVQFPLCVGMLALMCAPWLLAAGPTLLSRATRTSWATSVPMQLVLGWTLLYCVLAATINHVTPRYLLPAAAPLSILFGGALARADADALRRWLRRAAVGLTLCVVASAAIVGLLSRGGPMGLSIGIAATVMAVVGMLLWSRRWQATGQSALIAILLNAAILGAGLGLNAWRGAGIVEHVNDESAVRIVFAGEAAQVSQLRVLLGGATPVVAASSAERIKPTDVLVLDEDRAGAWNLSGRRVQVTAHGQHVPEAAEVVEYFSRADFSGLMRRVERRFVIAGPQREATATAEGAGELRVQ